MATMFVQINANPETIVNIKHISKIELKSADDYTDDKTYEVTLSNGATAEMSNKGYDALLRSLECMI